MNPTIARPVPPEGRTLPGLLATARPPFLLLTLACVTLGLGLAAGSGHAIDGFALFMVTLGALAAHVSVNVFNEYFDYKVGLDAMTERTPFSGGSGALPAHPEISRHAWWFAWGAFAVTMLVGVFFVATRGVGLLPIGLLGLLVVLGYTPWITRRAWLCLVAPGLGFGPLMVLGTYYALTGTYSVTAAWVSLVPFFLVNNLLLLNQFPDVEADRKVGRSNLPIRVGRPAAAGVYAAMNGLAFAVLPLGYAFGVLPMGALLGLLAAPLAAMASARALRNADDIPALIPALGLNVAVNLATPVMMALGVWWFGG